MSAGWPVSHEIDTTPPNFLATCGALGARALQPQGQQTVRVPVSAICGVAGAPFTHDCVATVPVHLYEEMSSSFVSVQTFALTVFGVPLQLPCS